MTSTIFTLIIGGPIGTGKTHLAIALGIEAARVRRRVLFVRAADVVRMLLEARDARELGRLHRRLQHVELLILDELGFVPFDRVGGVDQFPGGEVDQFLSGENSRGEVGP